MNYFHRKLNQLLLLTPFRNQTSSSDVAHGTMDQSPTTELDILSLPSCSKSEDDHSSGANSDCSISSLLTSKKVYIKRTLKAGGYQDAVKSASYSKSDFVIEALQWHNILRSRHGVAPLMLSLDLCQRAQFWANHLSHTDSFYHRNEPDIGENLLAKWTYYSQFDPSDHFTQLIWKSSQYFGIGKARTRNGKMIVVANYKPAGNVFALFHNNVLPLIMEDIDFDGSMEYEMSLRSSKSRARVKSNKLLSPISTISGSLVK